MCESNHFLSVLPPSIQTEPPSQLHYPIWINGRLDGPQPRRVRRPIEFISSRACNGVVGIRGETVFDDALIHCDLFDVRNGRFHCSDPEVVIDGQAPGTIQTDLWRIGLVIA